MKFCGRVVPVGITLFHSPGKTNALNLRGQGTESPVPEGLVYRFAKPFLFLIDSSPLMYILYES